MGLADWIRIMRGNLTPEEIAERDGWARARRELAEAQATSNANAAHWEVVRQERLRKAAGISSVDLMCHGDTWAFINRECVDRSSLWPNYEERGRRTTDLGGGLVKIHLSGPQIAYVLERMRWVTHDSYLHQFSSSERALAQRVYDVTAEVVDGVDLNMGQGAPVPALIVDAQVPRKHDDEQ